MHLQKDKQTLQGRFTEPVLIKHDCFLVSTLIKKGSVILSRNSVRVFSLISTLVYMCEYYETLFM